MFDAAHNRRNAMEQRRLLHARIARTRRRIDGHASRLIGGGCLPSNWRRRIQHHPVIALASAAGAGMLLAQLCSRDSGTWLAEWLAGATWSSTFKQVERFLRAGRDDDMPQSSDEAENA